MSTERAEHMLVAPLADLERALVDSFLQGRGLDARGLAALPQADRDHVLREASTFASARLADIEAKAHYLHELHRPG